MIGVAAGDRMILEFAKVAGEGDVLGAGDVLVAEKQHLVLQQQRADLGHQPGIARGGAKVHVRYFGADSAGQRLGLRCVVLGGGRGADCGPHCRFLPRSWSRRGIYSASTGHG